MLILENKTEISDPKYRKNVFSPAQIKKMGGIDAVIEKFKDRSDKPLPNLDFTEKEWEEMLKNEK